jgi:hypothetical protein
MRFCIKASRFSSVPVGVRAAGKIIYTCVGNRDSSVDTVTGYSLFVRNSIPRRDILFFFLNRSQAGSGTHLSNGYWWFFPGDKAAEA